MGPHFFRKFQQGNCRYVEQPLVAVQVYQCLREAAGAAEEAAHARDTLVAHDADLEAAVHQLQVGADAVMGLKAEMRCNSSPSHASSNPPHAVCSHAALQTS